MIPTCPTDNDLSAYGLGTLAPPEADLLERHLTDCERCQHQFDAVEGNADDLISDLQYLAGTDLPQAISPTAPAKPSRAASALTTRLQGKNETGNDAFVVSKEVANASVGRWADRPPADPAAPIPFTIDDVKDCLIENRLMSADDVDAAAATFAGSGQVGEATGFARHLVKTGGLTCFQAAEICLGRGAKLRIDDYIIEEEVGRGGMGRVYRARHTAMQRTVALKILSNRLFDQPETLERFRREALAVGRISHPNAVTAFDAGEDARTQYIVCEFVDGVTLSGLVEANGPLPLELAADLVRQAALGLQAAHDQGVIHRDVKPSNLLLSRQGQVKVADLGLVRFVEETTAGDDLTERGQVLGTLDYISPEQAFADGPIDHRTDIYSLGWTLYFLLTGKTAFPEHAQFSKLVAHRDSPIPSLQKCIPGLPDSVDQLFRKMVAKLPDDRPQSMSEVAEALSKVVLPQANRDFALVIPEAKPQQLDSFFRDLDIETSGLHDERRRQEQQAARRNRNNRRTAIAALAGMILLAIGVAIYLKTSTGELAVKFDGTLDEQVEFRIYDGRQEVAVLNRSNKWTAHLRGGRYSVVIVNGKERFRIVASTVDVAARRTTPIEIHLIVGTVPEEPVVAPVPKPIAIAPPSTKPPVTETANLIGETGQLAICKNIVVMTLSPDRQTAFVGGRNRSIYIIDLAEKKVVRRIVAHRAPVSFLAVSRDGTRIASCSGDRMLRIWDVKTGNRLQQIPLGVFVRSLEFGTEPGVILVALDMKSLAAGRPGAQNGETEYRSLMEYDTTTGRAREPITDETMATFHSLDCSADGRIVVAGADDGTVRIIDRTKRIQVRQFPGHRGPVHAVRLSDDGKRLYSVGNANLILCRQFPEGKVVFGRRFRSGFTGIDFNRDESAFLLRGGPDVRFFDRNEQGDRSLTVLRGHSTYIRGLYFLADESRAVSGSLDGTLRFWKLPSRRFPSPE